MDWVELPFGTLEQRAAFNEALCRHLNERKAEWVKDGLPTAGFRCECVTMHCGSRFKLSPEQWEEARSRDNQFAVAPGHFDPRVELVVKEYPDFWLVQKRGEAEEIVEELA